MSDNNLFGLAKLLCRHACQWLVVIKTYLSAIVGFVEDVYVMTTNWFQLRPNAAIQLPSGPSVIVYFSVCGMEWEALHRCILLIYLSPPLGLHK